jgi:hypothetical protein
VWGGGTGLGKRTFENLDLNSFLKLLDYIVCHSTMIIDNFTIIINNNNLKLDMRKKIFFLKKIKTLNRVHTFTILSLLSIRIRPIKKN